MEPGDVAVVLGGQVNLAVGDVNGDGLEDLLLTDSGFIDFTDLDGYPNIGRAYLLTGQNAATLLDGFQAFYLALAFSLPWTSVAVGAAVLGAISGWFLAFNLVQGPIPGLSRQIRGSAIVRGIDGVLPRPPSVLAQVRDAAQRAPAVDRARRAVSTPPGCCRWSWWWYRSAWQAG